jgi:hypothetical protein
MSVLLNVQRATIMSRAYMFNSLCCARGNANVLLKVHDKYCFD